MAARAALIELGVLPSADPMPPFWARMSGNLVLIVYPEKPPFFVVKVGIRTSLEREFRGLSAGYEAMPRHVPRPLGLTTQSTHEILVTEGVPHEPLVPGREREWHAMFERDVGALLAASAHLFRASPSNPAANVREALREAAGAIGWSGWQAYWDRVDSVIARLPRVPQHGDLALNNIALANGGLVFFDWEDFGLVDLAGFDLAVVLLSIHNFSLARLRDNLRASTMGARLVARWCEHAEMAPGSFWELLPAYLALFIELKRSGGYDRAVPERAMAALRDWIDCETAPGAAA